ncbi:MAG: IS3 family transposase [Sulfuricellaceae bacterium]|nr:IS3 family transposase [Sulfuricellaceae bacterium]
MAPSERGACRLAGLSRDSYRHPPEADQLSKDLSGKIVEIAHARRRFGYRRIHDLLRPEFHGVNHERVYRLHSGSNLAVLRRKKIKRQKKQGGIRDFLKCSETLGPLPVGPPAVELRMSSEDPF